MLAMKVGKKPVSKAEKEYRKQFKDDATFRYKWAAAKTIVTEPDFDGKDWWFGIPDSHIAHNNPFRKKKSWEIFRYSKNVFVIRPSEVFSG